MVAVMKILIIKARFTPRRESTAAAKRAPAK